MNSGATKDTAAATHATRDAWNAARYVAGTSQGHYESWFQRANHPTRSLAFWIRYTIFSPAGDPAAAVGELWAIFFDGERGRITTVKQEHPIRSCRFDATRLEVAIGPAMVSASRLDGSASMRGSRIAWSLDISCDQEPLLLLPQTLYARGLPKAKALVGSPNARFRGTMSVDGENIAIDGWTGSQNHNWGSRHTDSYAWGQVAGFDDARDAFLECSTASIRIGPFLTPHMSLVVLRDGGDEIRLNSLRQSLRARGTFRFFDWTIESATPDVRVSMHMHAPRSSFVALTYPNPPGGTKTCLNTKLAACEVVIERSGKPARRLSTRHRAAFEILTDRGDHGIEVVVGWPLAG